MPTASARKTQTRGRHRGDTRPGRPPPHRPRARWAAVFTWMLPCRSNSRFSRRDRPRRRSRRRLDRSRGARLQPGQRRVARQLGREHERPVARQPSCRPPSSQHGGAKRNGGVHEHIEQLEELADQQPARAIRAQNAGPVEQDAASPASSRSSRASDGRTKNAPDTRYAPSTARLGIDHPGQRREARGPERPVGPRPPQRPGDRGRRCRHCPGPREARHKPRERSR